ncbi:MAG TPA: XRE family transcriptional regulator [Sulfurospirillum sp. UBA11407]|jgi:transcriptional regulator with XRE-family HTH domain|nr:MAG TPA: XRE family transcriptional regulator [Sulfurospirillum sp. UBA11407]DAB33177.1 MAG TPA: XRE family transcriptional regulator [Sulfurospirillum sp. UBA12182]
MDESFNVGVKIKNLRQEKGLSAKALAKAAKISVGMLSQLERGSTQGSVETLRKIAKVLDTTLAALFESEERVTTNLTHESLMIVRADKRKKISFPDPLYKCELLTPDLQGDIEFVLVELEAGRITDEMLPHTKGGEEIDLVIAGVIEVTLENESFTLYEGDSIRFNPDTPHKIENKSEKKASYISVITPPSF